MKRLLFGLRLLKRNLNNRSNAMPDMSPLRQQMLDDMTVRNPFVYRGTVMRQARQSLQTL